MEFIITLNSKRCYYYIRVHSVIGETHAMASNIDSGLGDNRLAEMVELVANQKQFG